MAASKSLARSLARARPPARAVCEGAWPTSPSQPAHGSRDRRGGASRDSNADLGRRKAVSARDSQRDGPNHAECARGRTCADRKQVAVKNGSQNAAPPASL